jgi:hypothetical protein
MPAHGASADMGQDIGAASGTFSARRRLGGLFGVAIAVAAWLGTDDFGRAAESGPP